MSEKPTITSVLAVPGIGAPNRMDDNPAQAANPVYVGIELDEIAVAWGTTIPPQGFELINQLPPYRTSAILATVRNTISPILVGRQVDHFRELAPLVQTLEETVSIPVAEPPVENPPPGITRREIISGFLASPDQPASAPHVAYQDVTRRLHPSLRLGLCQALLKAVAHVRQLTLTEVLADEFHLPVGLDPVSILMPIRRGQTLQLVSGVDALSFSVDASDPKSSLGQTGERLQRFVRQLRTNITAADLGRSIAIYLDLAGAFGKHYKDDLGKILGALYGLEQAAAPGLIYVQDPFDLADAALQLKALGQLQDYLRMRNMSLQLVAGRAIHNLEDVYRYVQEKPVHMLHLNMARIGSIQETVLANLACQENGMGVLLSGPLAELSAQVALAVSPDFVAPPAGRSAQTGLEALFGEIARTHAWLERRQP